MSPEIESPAETPRTSIFRSPYVWAFLIGIITLTLMRPMLRHVPDPPSVIGHVPSFALVDQDGRPFGSDDLSGRVYVVNFFFTSCRSICIPLMQAVAEIDKRYRETDIDDIHLVSITVDPETDTPGVLKKYGQKLGVDPSRWTLLTGDRDSIEALVVKGFKTAMSPPEETPGGFFDIAHSGKLVIVDQDANIRGYYDHDTLGRDEVYHRSIHVLFED